MTTDDIATLARAAGAAGRSWGQFCCDDAVQDYVNEHGGSDVDLDAWRAAFNAGEVEHLAGQGWVSRWTTAPADYDVFGTTTAELCGDWRGKPLRRILCHPHHAGYQAGRNSSGMHPTFDVDPRVEEREAAERAERRRAEDAARAARRDTGLVWLAAASEQEIDDARDRDEVESSGLTYRDLDDELKRRQTARVEAERAAEWERCATAVRPGMILIDDGEPSRQGQWGRIPGREPAAHYDVRITNDWAKVADQATVVDGRGAAVGALSSVADWIASGRLRVVSADAVPPEPVVRRLGLSGFRPLGEIRRVDVDGRPAWVGRGSTDYHPIALDERGHLVRGRRAAAAVEAYLTAKTAT